MRNCGEYRGREGKCWRIPMCCVRVGEDWVVGCRAEWNRNKERDAMKNREDGREGRVESNIDVEKTS